MWVYLGKFSREKSEKYLDNFHSPPNKLYRTRTLGPIIGGIPYLKYRAKSYGAKHPTPICTDVLTQIWDVMRNRDIVVNSELYVGWA